jgi:hypothetical protein
MKNLFTADSAISARAVRLGWLSEQGSDLAVLNGEAVELAERLGRRSWVRWNLLRTTLSIGSFIALAIALLRTHGPNDQSR